MKKSKKYILEQKDKYAAKINETQAFTEAYEMALETGDLDILEDLLRETDKRAEFISEIWLSFVGDRDTMLQFSTKVAIQELSSRYTPELGKKVEELYSQKKMKFFNVFSDFFAKVLDNNFFFVYNIIIVVQDTRFLPAF